MGPAARGRGRGGGWKPARRLTHLLPHQRPTFSLPSPASWTPHRRRSREHFAISRTQLSVPNSQGNPTGDKMLRNYLLGGTDSPDSLVSFFHPLLEDCSGGTCPRLRIQVSKDASPSWMND